MPDDSLVAEMYGKEYNCADAAIDRECTGCALDDPRETERVVKWLARNEPGVFIDYGCRDGELLAAAARLGWRAFGVEIDREVARATSERTGVEVLTPDDNKLKNDVADVVHLGDVIEHLTR